MIYKSVLKEVISRNNLPAAVIPVIPVKYFQISDKEALTIMMNFIERYTDSHINVGQLFTDENSREFINYLTCSTMEKISVRSALKIAETETACYLLWTDLGHKNHSPDGLTGVLKRAIFYIYN